MPVVWGGESGWTDLFTKTVLKCEKINVPLSENCELHEKAFGPATFGTVGGVKFDSERMEWSISVENKRSWRPERKRRIFAEKKCTLLEIQKRHGKLSNFAQACEFMLGYRHHLICLLRKFGQEGVSCWGEPETYSTELKVTCWVWQKVVRLLVYQKDRTGAYFGSKSATLETIDLLRPSFFVSAESFDRKPRLLKVDNTAVIYAWRKKYTVNDP